MYKDHFKTFSNKCPVAQLFVERPTLDLNIDTLNLTVNENFFSFCDSRLLSVPRTSTKNEINHDIPSLQI